MRAVKVTRDFADLEKLEVLAKEAFPPAEYLSPTKILDMQDKGEFELYGLYDGEDFVGFITTEVYDNMVYLYFLAIDSQARCKGYGSKALRLLGELYPGYQQVIDLELVDENAENNAQRIRRRGFYLRNGYKATGKAVRYFGMEFELLCNDECFDFRKFDKMIRRLHMEGFDPEFIDIPVND